MCLLQEHLGPVHMPPFLHLQIYCRQSRRAKSAPKSERHLLTSTPRCLLNICPMGNIHTWKTSEKKISFELGVSGKEAMVV